MLYAPTQPIKGDVRTAIPVKGSGRDGKLQERDIRFIRPEDIQEERSNQGKKGKKDMRELLHADPPLMRTNC